MDIPKESLEILKCSRCNLHLSIGPVTTGTTGNSFLCGRCSSEGAQVNIYEVLAKNFVFPCRYQLFGCQEKIKWGMVMAHESNCTNKPRFCAALPPGICLWRGAPSDLAKHFKQNHAQNVIHGSMVELQLTNDIEECKLVDLQTQHYIFHAYFKKEQNILKLNVMQLDSIKPQSYQLTLHSQDFSKRITLAPNLSQLYSSTDHNNIKEENIIDMSVLKFLIGNKSIIFCAIALADEHKEINTEWLKLAECPVCNETMSSPIFQCQTGHSFCSICISKLKCCPLCNKELAGTRNYALEELVNQVSRHCKNQPLGCTHNGLFDDINKHEAICRFYRCPLQNSERCTWSGNFEDLISHCKDGHVFLATKSYGLVCSFDSLKEDGFGSFRLLYYDGMFFKICRKYFNEKFCVVVQFVGPSEMAANYLYEFSFAGNDVNTNLVLKNVCQPVTDEESAFENCLKIPYLFLVSFVQNNKLNCNIKITKK